MTIPDIRVKIEIKVLVSVSSTALPSRRSELPSNNLLKNPVFTLFQFGKLLKDFYSQNYLKG